MVAQPPNFALLRNHAEFTLSEVLLRFASFDAEDFADRLEERNPELLRAFRRLQEERRRVESRVRSLLSRANELADDEFLAESEGLFQEARVIERAENETLFRSLCLDIGCGD
ncbi:MAG: hypothetical protein HYV07_20975 [Deltaproteobacteria bacterium]|nr:hypothetical protein [Deltaproteobacteria bacterium]